MKKKNNIKTKYERRINSFVYSDFEKALLGGRNALGNSEFNLFLYKALRGHFSKWYFILIDEIQEFTKELNGVMIRTLDEDYKFANIAVSKFPGGSMDSNKLCTQPMRFTHSLYLFKFCTLDAVDFQEKKNQLFQNWPLALVGDGCSINRKAGEVLSEQIGLLSPTTRCSAHSASGSIKWMSSSQTMSVPFAEGLQPILRNFTLSGKNSSVLNDTLEIMEMKPIKLMAWCPTRMGNLLDCCLHAVNILVPPCDTFGHC